MKTLRLLSTLLAIPTALCQIVDYAKDGSFESVPQKSLYHANTAGGLWKVTDNAVFANNSDQPKGYTTPFGSQFVYFVQKTHPNLNGAVRQGITKLPTNQNLTFTYEYRVFENSNPGCSLLVVFGGSSEGGQVVDILDFPKGNQPWTSRKTKNFQSSSSGAQYSFAVGCQTPGKFGKFGLDNVGLLYDGCPACG